MTLVDSCECDWTQEHKGKQCKNPPAEFEGGKTSPVLCMACLYCCCAESDEVEGITPSS